MALLLMGLRQKPVAEIIPVTGIPQSARFLAGPVFTLHPIVLFTRSMTRAYSFMGTSQRAMDWWERWELPGGGENIKKKGIGSCWGGGCGGGTVWSCWWRCRTALCVYLGAVYVLEEGRF